jgi:hypothetical protein
VKRTLFAFTAIAALTATSALADPVRDWRDLAQVHERVVASIHDMERARAANHYDMAGHGAKAEAALHEAERQLRLAIQAAKASR